MSKPITWFSSSNGLNDRIDPARIQYDPETGVQDLAIAYNVHHDYTGRISRRLGYTITDIVTECHSLFCDGGDCLFVTGDALCVLAENLTYTPIRNVSIGMRMKYVQVANSIYYCNGFQIGFVKDQLSHTWSKPVDVRGPYTTRVFSSPPIGSLIAFHNARIYLSQGNVCWYSEPFGYNIFNLTKNHIDFPSQLRMMIAVKGGIFFSTDSRIYFAEGLVPEEFSLRTVANYPAIADTEVTVDGSMIAGGQLSLELCAMWTSKEGICLGLPDGRMINLTRNKLVYPYSNKGAGLYTGDRYIATLEP